ncbi:phosphoribosyltransferase [Candidatus Bathyarchaeota archaeon]|nr:phosphoribosyltransferase [Candidatus Bathyarchaeota archaeon]
MDWNRFYALSREVARKIKLSGYKPDVIIGLARGGWILSRVLCDFLGVKDLLSVKVEHWGITASPDGEARVKYPLSLDLSGRKVLVVDDITDTGESMRKAVEHVRALGPAEIRTAALRHIEGSRFTPDYYGEEIEWRWVIFPWNYVEDMCNLMPKALVLDGERVDFESTKAKLKERFGISINSDAIAEIHAECISRGLLPKREDDRNRIS